MTVSLCIDVDGAFPRGWVARFAWCCSLWRWRPLAVRVDKTRRGWHLVATATAPKDTTPAQLVAAQAILGSDPKREAFNLMRVAQLHSVPPFWRSRWNVLYERHSRPSSRRESSPWQRVTQEIVTGKSRRLTRQSLVDGPRSRRRR